MVFMRAVVTDTVGLCQVKSYHREFTAASLYMTCIEIHAQQTCPTLTQEAGNEIHNFIMIFIGLMTRVTAGALCGGPRILFHYLTN